MKDLICVSYNIKGLNSPIKRKKVLNQLKNFKCSIAMLQETHLSEKEHRKLRREWVEQQYSSTYQDGRKRGVAILVSRSTYFHHEKTFADREGRYVMVIGSVGGSKITLLNLYAPNEDCPQFFKNIASLIAEKSEGMILVGGDFNCTLKAAVDRLPAHNGPKSKKSCSLNTMIKELGLVDVWRQLHPREKDFTFYSHVHRSHSRIDMFLMPRTDLYRARQCSIEAITISDHAPVCLELRMNPNNHFKYWRANVSILNNETTRQDLQKSLSEYIQFNDNNEVSPSILWESAKSYLRGNIIAVSSRLKKERLTEQTELENKIKKLEKVYQVTKDTGTLNSLKEQRQKLDDLLTYKAEGQLRFANQKYYQYGNRASRLLAFQLRKEQSSRVVHKIKCPNSGKIVCQPKEVAKAFSLYYQELYKEENVPNKIEKIEQFLNPINLSKLSQEEAELITNPITSEEIKNSIGKLKNNKSPGVDGLPGEYYKSFEKELTPLLCKVYNYALFKGDPPRSWSEAIISVIHKESKDPTLCMSYRPISLLCVDLKILTAIIANRIQKHIKKLVKPDQTGFISHRQGSDNVRRALNLQIMAQERDTSSMFLSLDAEKAFDRVDWDFLQQTLRHMGFNETFISWVQTLYKNPKSRVRVNGHCSDFFSLGRGTRQGEVLSPSLFALSIEPLAELIRSNPFIQGIRDETNTQHKLSLFADDILLFLENPVTSVPALLSNLEDYGTVSGYKINTNKSEALMIVGNWPTQLDHLVSFRHSKQGFRYLGVIITPKTNQLLALNYDRLFGEIRGDLDRWNLLPLTFMGRIECIRMNILPRLLFLFQNLPILIPQSAFKLLESITSKFIWQNKRPRVRLKMLMSGKEKGGLKLPNFRMYYWAAQLKSMAAWIIHDPEMQWVSMEEYSLPGISLRSLPFLNPQSWKKIKITNPWVKHTVRIWNKVLKMLKGNLTMSRAIPINGNIEFLPSLSDRSFERWAEKGLITVNQLFEKTTLKSFAQLRAKYALSPGDHYRYLQLRDYITKHKDWDNIRREPIGLENHFIKLLEKSGTLKNQVSLIYQTLLVDMSDNTYHIKQQWEMELNIILDDVTWESVCCSCHRGVGSQMWKEFDWKVKLRFFRTPLKTFLSKSSVCDKCWRGCGFVGDQTHIFWDCVYIQQYWMDVKNIIQNILSVNLPMDPLIFLLDIFPDGFSYEQHFLLHLLLMTARKMITIHWLKPETPTAAQWLLKTRHVYTMERITAQLQLKVPTFEKKWRLIINYLERTLKP